jgi:hypothetical protein
MHCLKPGGIAIHTTEFNVSSNDVTFESPGLSFYRRKDIENLLSRLRNEGYEVTANLSLGNHPVDDIVTIDGQPWELCIKVRLLGYTITSLGLIIHKVR